VALLGRRKGNGMTTTELIRRAQELAYRKLECALTPDHPVTKANQARWDRELRQVEAELQRRVAKEESR
jgi:hypothetical protein